MKNKGIVIELTALLDVILIMLFWVMMNVQEQEQTVRADAQAQVEEYRQEALEAKKQLERAEAANRENAAYNALEDFENGRILTLDLRYDAVGKLYIFGADGELGRTLLDSGEQIAGVIADAVEVYEKDGSDIIMCTFIYDGSRALYRDISAVNAAIETVCGDHPGLYCTSVNTSR